MGGCHLEDKFLWGVTGRHPVGWSQLVDYYEDVLIRVDPSGSGASGTDSHGKGLVGKGEERQSYKAIHSLDTSHFFAVSDSPDWIAPQVSPAKNNSSHIHY